jgi:hypothetical protein
VVVAPPLYPLRIWGKRTTGDLVEWFGLKTWQIFLTKE